MAGELGDGGADLVGASAQARLVKTFTLSDRERGRDGLAAVLEAYDIDAEPAGCDVDAFIADLARVGLLAADVDFGP